MRLRLLVSLALLLLAGAAHAGEKTPAIVLRVRSVEAVLENAKLLVNLTGEQEAARQIAALLKAKVGVKGIEGVDPNRPLGAYVRFGREIEDVSGAVLVPIVDEKAFLDLLDRLNWLTSKGKNDIYTVQTGRPFDLYVRFVKRYACVTGINPDNLLDKNLLDPERVLAGKDQSLLSTLVRLDQLPDGAKLLAQFQLEQELQKAQEKAPPKETAAQRGFRIAVLRELARIVSSVLKDGAELRLDVSLDPAAKDFIVQMGLSAQPGSELDQALQKLGKSQSPFAGVARKDFAFFGGTDLGLPEPVNDALAKVIDEALAKSLAELRDEKKKKQAEDLFGALMPSMRAGRLDGFFAFAGPLAKQYTLLAGIEVRDGDKLGSTIRGLVAEARKDLPPREQDRIQLDVDKVGAVAIHKFELPPGKDGSDAQLQAIVGARDLYVAFRDDAAFFAVGKAALPTLKDAVAARGALAGPLFQFNFDVARLVPILAKTREQQELAQKVLQPGAESSLRIVVSSGESLTLRMQLKLSALEFLAKLKDRRD